MERADMNPSETDDRVPPWGWPVLIVAVVAVIVGIVFDVPALWFGGAIAAVVVEVS